MSEVQVLAVEPGGMKEVGLPFVGQKAVGGPQLV